MAFCFFGLWYGFWLRAMCSGEGGGLFDEGLGVEADLNRVELGIDGVVLWRA